MAEPFIFSGDGQSVEEWIFVVNAFFEENNIEEAGRGARALNRLSIPVRACTRRCSDLLETITEEPWDWTWPRLQACLLQLEDQIHRAEQEKVEKTMKAIAIGATTHILVPALVTLGLGLIGFSGSGPVKDTFASEWHSTIGNVRSPSLFSTFQSVSMQHANLSTWVDHVGEAARTSIELLKDSSPSTCWSDGARFQPSIEVIDALVNM
ncbi:hypothetical protein ACEPAI_9529 [Sanghuangporus weigelae]